MMCARCPTGYAMCVQVRTGREHNNALLWQTWGGSQGKPVGAGGLRRESKLANISLRAGPCSLSPTRWVAMARILTRVQHIRAPRERERERCFCVCGGGGRVSEGVVLLIHKCFRSTQCQPLGAQPLAAAPPSSSAPLSSAAWAGRRQGTLAAAARRGEWNSHTSIMKKPCLTRSNRPPAPLLLHTHGVRIAVDRNHTSAASWKTINLIGA